MTDTKDAERRYSQSGEIRWMGAVRDPFTGRRWIIVRLKGQVFPFATTPDVWQGLSRLPLDFAGD
jgi:hypothetical protein